MPWPFIGFWQQVDNGAVEGFSQAPQIPYGHVVADASLNLANLGLRHSGFLGQLLLSQAGQFSLPFKEVANVHFLPAGPEKLHSVPAPLHKKKRRIKKGRESGPSLQLKFT
jgi:hypothetical protein